MPSLKPRMARPLRPENTMQQAGSTWVEVIMDERASTVKEDVMRLLEAQSQEVSTSLQKRWLMRRS